MSLEATPDQVEYWADLVRRYYVATSPQRTEFIANAKRYAGRSGERGDVTQMGETITDLEEEGTIVEANVMNLVIRTTVAEAMFKNPEFVVRPTHSIGGPLYNQDLAKTETQLLNDWVQDANFFEEGRESLTDGRLGDMAIMKFGYSADITAEGEDVDAQRELARRESIGILLGKSPMVKSSDLDQVHLEQHDMALAMAQSGQVETTKGRIEYLKKHIAKHQERLAKGLHRPRETVRNERVFGRRVHPLLFIHDWMTERTSDWQFVGQAMIRDVSEVKNHQSYSQAARNEVQASRIGEAITNAQGTQTTDDTDTCVVYEVVDLARGRVLTWAHGGTMFLRNDPYLDWDILPNGPYEICRFSKDPLTGKGVPLPRHIEGHQDALERLENVLVAAAERSVPQVAVNGDKITDDELETTTDGVVGRYIKFKGLNANDDVRKVFQGIPVPEISPQLVAIADRQWRHIERLSGKGSARLAGGEFSQTATASAIVAESTTTLADDDSAVWDHFMMRAGRHVLRLMRRYYSAALVGELVGIDGLKSWPKPPDHDPLAVNGYANRDILNDRGADVIFGSSRRKNSAIHMKLLTDFFGLVTGNPVLLQLLPPSVFTNLLQQTMNTLGVTVDITGQQDQIAQAQKQAAQAMSGGPQPASTGTGNQGDQRGGVANTGGGRVPTGASQGDRPRAGR